MLAVETLNLALLEIVLLVVVITTPAAAIVLNPIAIAPLICDLNVIGEVF